MQLIPKEDRLMLEIDREQKYQTLKEEWVSQVRKDTWMDFVIFHDDFLLGDDNPKMTQCLNYQPQAGVLSNSMLSKNKSLGATQSSFGGGFAPNKR